MIRLVFDAAAAAIDHWHNSDLKFFAFEPTSHDSAIFTLSVKLAYHNYQTWHYEDLGKLSVDPAVALHGYHGTVVHNRGRNEAIEQLDRQFCSLQHDTGEWHSETLGMMLDRLTILQLKLRHAEVQKPEMAHSIQQQLSHLLDCAQKLYNDMRAGTKKCIAFSHVKLYHLT